jgi:hypothetical protein
MMPRGTAFCVRRRSRPRVLRAGHGGAKAADYALETLPADLRARLAAMPAGGGEREIQAAVSAAFVDLDRDFLARARAERLTDGTTALLALLRADTLHVSWVGDSRGVLSRRGRAVRLSEDHKPDRPDERKAIEARGGSVVFRGAYRPASLPRRGAHECVPGHAESAHWQTMPLLLRMALTAGVCRRVAGPTLSLAVSRSIGDLMMKVQQLARPLAPRAARRSAPHAPAGAAPAHRRGARAPHVRAPAAGGWLYTALSPSSDFASAKSLV